MDNEFSNAAKVLLSGSSANETLLKDFPVIISTPTRMQLIERRVRTKDNSLWRVRRIIQSIPRNSRVITFNAVVDRELTCYSNMIGPGKTTAPSPQQALSGQGVPRIPGKYAIAEGCCRKIQNGPSMVLRLGTLNVGSLTGRSMEITEMLECRRIDICCLQETQWKSNGVCHVNSDKEKYKLFWNGQKTAKNGVGIFVREPLAQEVLDIKRLSSRDLNGHVGEKTDGFDNVHGGFGYGKRNEDGNRILEFAESHGFYLLNTYFRKSCNQKYNVASKKNLDIPASVKNKK
ncbi:hypothetical protein HELRODRAFT_182739 [Helobdella robusta]|uniref:Endonuclease/exonuclease/phosphatase domain-containing protein n=1 Tax=Helobdella robusta TaxID=6412 RepID=T1FIN7_HELRO|nr:hypothetical protein HELRODRAFT_182739 [Helobdella robusta]ESN90233.1 hypothetical protein HELRODRAFT_182739 [Helobdella robusta]